MTRVLHTFLFLLSFCLAIAAHAAPAGATLAARTAALQKIDGFVPLYWSAGEGKLLMELPPLGTEILYQVSLSSGLGSNPVGLDRGQLAATMIVLFERIGPRVLMVQPNYGYRAITDDAAERRTVEESFARSVIWGFDVEAAEGDRILVDATSFFLRDAHGVADRLQATQQGRYTLDPSRSAFHLERTKGFPLNTEVETILTFAAQERPGPLVTQVTPSPRSITIRQHHSLVQAPDAGFKPRRFDPRAGYFGIEFYDYSSPITEPVEQRWIARHRLEKKDPSAAVSEPVNPIIYYLDAGTPEPIRSALLDGARWWNEAFEAAGFRNAFEVRMLPPDADPMDVRYNVIHWVHRSTRGWSYGGGIVDPRTGEIIKGNVNLGSLRVRQDWLLGSGLIPLFDGDVAAPTYDYLAAMDPSVNAAQMALARIRQLSAHEIGHTLGIAHNFAASTYGRASVMDYPAPLVQIRDGRLDLSNAYGVGLGAWDIFAVRWGYTEFPPGTDEDAALRAMLREASERGLLYITDADTHHPGAAHPLANVWDNGSDPIAELAHVMEVRRIALDDFGLANIPAGTPLSMLEARLLPLYLHHRYQVAATAKSIGGMHYTYAVKEVGAVIPPTVREIVAIARQRQALELVLSTLEPSFLRIPQSIIDILPPPAQGFTGGTIELFPERSAPVFDPVGVATIAADITISPLLQPHRAARMMNFHAENRQNPDFSEVTNSLIARTWGRSTPTDGYEAAILLGVQSVTVAKLMDLAADPAAATPVRAVATETLRLLAAQIGRTAGTTPAEVAHRRLTVDDIQRFLERPDQPRSRTTPLPIPPGPPI